MCAAALVTMVRMVGGKRFVRTLEAGKDVVAYESADGKGKLLAAWPKERTATAERAVSPRLAPLKGSSASRSLP
ncbi:MAG: hypothetical protein FJ291_30990 [Planctomycetes bacterium]|nr:hypothetical protein [Planctomycetota bacterium]